MRRSGGEDFRRVPPPQSGGPPPGGQPPPRGGADDEKRDGGPLQRARQPFRRLRRLLLVLGVMAVLVVVLLLAAYNFGRSGVQAPLPRTDDTASTDGAISRAEEVRFKHSSGGQLIFQVWAESQTIDERGVSHLEGVRVVFYRQDGTSYQVTSRQATIDQDTKAALFDGDVQVRGWRNLELDARAIEVARGGGIISSRGAVDFRWLDEAQNPYLAGRASALRIDRAEDVITLDEGVHVRTVPGVEPTLRLDAQRLSYARSESLIRALDDVHLTRDNQEITCRALSLFLHNDQRSLKLARARFDVEGQMVTRELDGGLTRVSFRGELLEMRPAEADPALQFIDLDRDEGEPVRMIVHRPDGSVQDLVADQMSARTRDNRLTQIEAITHRGTGVSLTEYLDFPRKRFVLRRACSDRMVAGFDSAGALSQLFLRGQVEMRDRNRQLTGGDQATYNAANDRLEISGPGVEVLDPRGDLYAPKLTLQGEKGLLQAEGGVEATLSDSADQVLAGTPLGQGQGPIRVTSERAVWTDSPPGFVFQDRVRAWQGDNLLLADQLRGDQVQNEMAASGGVTTLWTPQGGSVKRPVEVKAETMTFRDDEGELHYDGGVRLTSDQRKLDCRSMVVELGPGGRDAERMLCNGDVVLVDPVGGKRVTGERAVFGVAADLIEVFGEVELQNADGSKAFGDYMRYEVESGATSLKAHQPDEPAPEVSIRERAAKLREVAAQVAKEKAAAAEEAQSEDAEGNGGEDGGDENDDGGDRR